MAIRFARERDPVAVPSRCLSNDASQHRDQLPAVSAPGISSFARSITIPSATKNFSAEATAPSYVGQLKMTSVSRCVANLFWCDFSICDFLVLVSSKHAPPIDAIFNKLRGDILARVCDVSGEFA